MNEQLKVTFDTNVLREYLDVQAHWRIAKEIFDLAKVGQFDLTITTRIRADIPNDPLARQAEKLLQELKIKPSPAAARWDVSKWNEDVWACEAFAAFLCELERRDQARGYGKRKIPALNDRDHLQGHVTTRRDMLITWDKNILRWGEELKREFGAISMNPQDFLLRFKQEGERLKHWAINRRMHWTIKEMCKKAAREKRAVEPAMVKRALEQIVGAVDDLLFEEKVERLVSGGILWREGGMLAAAD